ncbi:MAG: S9 family peptidase [Hyphomicrobiales bacterium]|nr:S9 family peptidase [Hyphomicrobiales bacterium]
MDARSPTGGKTATAPVAARIPRKTSVHGVTLRDDYGWLRAANWQEVMRDPAKLPAEIRQYLEAENEYTEAAMAPAEALRQELFAEMRARIKEDDASVPAPDGPWAYFVRYHAGGQYPLFCRLPRGKHAPVQILLDGDAMGAGKPYFAIAGASHSRDHRHIAYSLDEAGGEFYTLRVREAESGRDLPDMIEGTLPGAVWSADGGSLFYVRLDDNHRSRWVYRHLLGGDPADDALVYEETDPAFFVGIGETQDRRYILVHAHEHQTSETHLIDAETPEAAPRCVLAREDGHEYRVEHHSGELFILTNKEAEDFRIVSAPVSDPDPARWREAVPHVEGRIILALGMLKRHMVRLERADGLPRIVVRRLADGAEHAIAFDEEAYSLALEVGYEFETDTIRFTYSSMTTPARVYDYNMESRERRLRKEQEVPSGHNPDDYATRRIHAPSHDGAEVPVTLLYRKDTPLDGSAPLYLYGYGAYGIAIPAAFSTNRLSLVDRGFVFALAHVRGGKDKGYGWYKAGRREHKMNSFTDFIAAAEHLIAEGYTARGRIVAEGRSAGGMLVGAAANRTPDLFLGIVAGVPFVDVLNTMLDETLPLTPPEWNEWGNPVSDAKAFATIRSYSPYDNVAARAYPHILATAGLTDPRVTYWEPAKWVAKLRTMKRDDRLLLLRTIMDAGHAGRSGRFEALREIAFDYAFALTIAGKA